MNNGTKNVAKALLFISVLAMGLLGCSGCQKGTGIGGTTIGDGKVDAVEAAEIRVAVGLALAAKPELIAPAYAVSTAILAAIDFSSSTSSTIPQIDSAVAKEVAKLKLDPITQQSFNDLIVLVKAQIQDKFKELQIPESSKLLVVKDIITIVQQTSAARLGIIK